MLGAPLDELAQARRVPQIEHAHAAPRDLVLVRRPDAAPGRSDRRAGRARAVDQLVVRQDEVRAVADVQAALDVDAVLDQPVDLGEERVRIEHDAVAERAAHAGVEDAARDLVQDEHLVADVHRVAGVRAALVAHDPVGAFGEDVDEFALPFVAPLGADDDDRAVGLGEHLGRAALRKPVGKKNRPGGSAGALKESTAFRLFRQTSGYGFFGPT